jgi:hypothetical protein
MRCTLHEAPVAGCEWRLSGRLSLAAYDRSWPDCRQIIRTAALDPQRSDATDRYREGQCQPPAPSQGPFTDQD